MQLAALRARSSANKPRFGPGRTWLNFYRQFGPGTTADQNVAASHRFGRGPRARAPTASFRHNTLLVALIIVFPVIGLEQFLHTTPFEFQRQPMYEALHWLSDSLLALPLAALAVWVGNWLATRLGLGISSISDVFTRACMIALVLAVLLVPGEALHQQVDQLTHTHASLGFHSHGTTAPTTASGPLALTDTALHGLSDGLQGQAVGLPLAFGALWLARDTRRRRQSRTPRIVTATKKEVRL